MGKAAKFDAVLTEKNIRSTPLGCKQYHFIFQKAVPPCCTQDKPSWHLDGVCRTCEANIAYSLAHFLNRLLHLCVAEVTPHARLSGELTYGQQGCVPSLNGDAAFSMRDADGNGGVRLARLRQQSQYTLRHCGCCEGRRHCSSLLH